MGLYKMKMTIEDFKKLIKFEEYMICLDGEEVSLFYDDAEDEDGGTFDNDEWNRLSFTFVGDRFTTVHNCEEFLEGNWTVSEIIEIDWRNTFQRG